MIWHKKFGPAQNILGPVKGQGKRNSKLILPVVGQSTSSTPGLQQSEVQSVDVSSGTGHSVGYTVSTSVVFHVRHFSTWNLNRFTIYNLTPLYRGGFLHTTYRINNNLEKCAGMGLNGFHIKLLIGTHCN